jgi:transposase-like protein
MAKKYQTGARKSNPKFEVQGGKEVAVRLPLPLVEVWEELQPEVEHLPGMAGLKIIRAVIEDEVRRRVGPRYQPDAESSCVSWGQQPGYVVFAGQKVAVERPRVRTRKGEEVSLDSYERLQHDGRRQRAVREGIVAGLTSRNYHRAVQRVLEGYGIEKSSVSGKFVQASAAQLKKLCEKKLEDLDLVAILMDGIHLGQQVLVVALGIQSNGNKQVLGLWQGATENTTVGKELLEDQVARGLHPERRYLFVIDGAKALRAAIERVFGERAEVQHCQIQKRRNVKEHLPKSAQGDTNRRIRNACAMTGYAEAKAELGKIFRQLERINPSAARSLEEGLEETLTVHRLGVGTLLRKTLASTNPIESCLSTVERVAHNVKRWPAGDHALRWTATGLLEAKKKFRRVKGYRELEILQRKLNPSLTQKEQVA